MGNLEKLGILVIVILVVVVGVVAITPSETLFPDDTSQLTNVEGERRTLDPAPDVVPPWPEPSDPIWQPIERDPSVQQDPVGRDPSGGAAPLGRGIGSGTDAGAGIGADPGPATVPPPVDPIRPQVTPEPADAPSPAPATKTYVIASGDNLSKIAAKLLGDAGLWREIAALNPGLDANRVRVGQEILVPVSASLPRSAGSSPAPRSEPASGSGTIYVVQKGDTLSGIARELLPSRSWRKLLEHNSDILSSPEKLRPGMKLRIPAGGTTRASDPTPPASGASGRTYVVERGDTLGAIARREMGKENLWRKLLEHNSDVLSDPRSLRPGMKLRIPE